MSLTVLVLIVGAVIILGAGALAWIYRTSSRPDRPIDDDQPVAIASGAETELAILESKLTASGIHSFTRNRSGVYPYRSPLYGWELLVRYGDLNDARRELDLDHDGDDVARELSGAGDEPRDWSAEGGTGGGASDGDAGGGDGGSSD